MRWYCLRVRVVVGTKTAASPSSASSRAAVSVMKDSGLLSCTSTQSSRGASGVRHGQRERRRRVDERTVEVAGDQDRVTSSADTALPSAPVAPRVYWGWIKPDAGVRQFVHLLDRHAALLGEQPDVVQVGARRRAARGSSTAPGAAAPGSSRRRRA